MRKFALAAALLACFLLAGCGKKPTAYIPPAAPSESAAPTLAPSPSSAASEEVISASSAPTRSEDDFSAIPEEIRPLFDSAQTLYNYFELAPPPTEAQPSSINGLNVYHVLPSAFENYAAFYRAVLTSFTEDFTEDVLFGKEEYFSLGDELYTSLTPRSANSTFQYAEAQLQSRETSEIRFTVTAHYYEAYQPKKLQNTTKTVEYTAVLTDSGWRFSQFGGYL